MNISNGGDCKILSLCGGRGAAALPKRVIGRAGAPRRPYPRTAGFTLVEMLAVVVLIAILMASAGMSVRKANQIAKNAKAEAECRELVNAILEYRSVYGEWPGGDSAKGEVKATENFLKPLINASDNDRGLVFLNLTLTDKAWNDPWGRPYVIFFPDGSREAKRPTALETCVSFPFRRPYLGD